MTTRKRYGYLNRRRPRFGQIVNICVTLILAHALPSDTAAGTHAEPKAHATALPRLGLVSLPLGQLKASDIASKNLACAEGLFKAESANVEEYWLLLDQWAKRLKSETERHLYRFRENPEQFENSECYFRMLMMAVVLYEDFGVRYNTNRMSNSTQPRFNDGFFADSRDVFIHGLLGPRRTGTCSSMPVLYVALGRRLGYPLKLVKAKGHLFCRWESADGRERFNIEATSKGLNSFSDDYYKQWPHPMSEADVKSGHYLGSLTPQEELALFLQTRGHCLKANGRLTEAKTAYEQAKRLAPDWPEHDLLIASLNLE